MNASNTRGSVLVITLALVVLVTGLVLAFFIRVSQERRISDAMTSHTKVEIFARSAIDAILGDLREEIVLGSEKITLPADSGEEPLTLYFPKTAAEMIPRRNGPADIPNLLRSSLRGDLPSSLAASPVSSASAARGGRSIPRHRWNRHGLIPRPPEGDPPVNPEPIASFTPPDWIMVAGDGIRELTAPDQEIIGRFAFVIYDEGGLLDLNVAGYPSGLATSHAGEVAARGSLALADLGAVGLSPEQVDELVGWRNQATLGPSEEAPGNFVNYIRESTHGFLSVNPRADAAATETDQMFPGRQALLRFWRAKGFPQDALQYVGTFSRDLEQPSWRPDPTRPKNTGSQPRSPAGSTSGYGGNDSYDPEGKLQHAINPAPLTVRGPDGEPVLRRRFPLGRLGLLNEAQKILLGGGTLPTDLANRIRTHFGLTWEPADARWLYAHDDPNQIHKLSDIPDGREPDFFETLKAAIECGSLGKQHGGNDNNKSPNRFLNNDPGIDGSVNYQIMQIAANLIDQSDEDSYPTRIAFDERMFHGIENVPYLAGWMSAWYRERLLTADDLLPGAEYQPPEGKYPYQSVTLLQPILWNPHAGPPAGTVSAAPTGYRVVAGGFGTGTLGAQVRARVRSLLGSEDSDAWWPDAFARTLPSFPLANPTGKPVRYDPAIVSPLQSFITFETTATGPASFREPYRLHAPDDPPGSGTSAYAEGVVAVIDDLEGSGFSQALGIYTGRAWTGPAGVADGDYFCRGSLSRDLCMELQYRSPYGSGPEYLGYDRIDQIFTDANPTGNPLNQARVEVADRAVTPLGMRTGFRADPRTNRWGLTTMLTSPSWPSSAPHWNGIGSSPPPEIVSTNSPIFHFPQGRSLGGDTSSATGVFYRMRGDSSGSLPKASGWHSPGGSVGGQGPSDLMVNLKTVPGQTALASQSLTSPGGKAFYTDADGVLRRASGAYYTPAATSPIPGLPPNTGNTASRPVILNRPFRSVAEMGYAFRGTAWKEIDFFTPESGDTALLDAFCLQEIDNLSASALVAGRVNLNTRQPKVLEALLRGVSKAEGDVLTPGEAERAAAALVGWTSDVTTQTGDDPPILLRGPLRHRGELIGKWIAPSADARLTTASPSSGGYGLNRIDGGMPHLDGALAFSGFSSLLKAGAGGVFSNAPDAAIKRRRESVIRALADSGNVRTWNLLIDVIAQTGRYSGRSAGLDDFIVEGESHLWVHVAIDRFTGDILDWQIEPVHE